MAGVAGLAGCSGAPAALPQQLDAFGLQLSTVTPQLLADFPGTLRRVAAIGYKQVEFSALGFLGRDVAEVEELLQANSLTAPVGRISPQLAPEFYRLERKQQRAAFMAASAPEHTLTNVAAAIPSARRLGQKSLVLPLLTPDRFQTMAQLESNIELLQKAGALCAAEGLKFGYHNHNWEFAPINGVIPYDLMLQETDPAEVTFQLDAYWVTKGGGDLFDYLQRFPGRFSSCHMKDIDTAGGFADVGDGLIDFPRFTREALLSGAQHFFVERDGPPEPMISAARSYSYLQAMTF